MFLLTAGILPIVEEEETEAEEDEGLTTILENEEEGLSVWTRLYVWW